MRLVKLALLAAALTANTSAKADLLEWNGHSYNFIKGTINWNDSKSAAEALGGHLVTITSAAENQFLMDNFGEGVRSGAWIGAFQPDGNVEPAGGWTWITGETWDYSQWGPGEPNNDNNSEWAGQFDTWGQTPFGNWNDQSADFAGAGYFVEFENGSSKVPDAASTFGLLGFAVAGLGLVRSKL